MFKFKAIEAYYEKNSMNTDKGWIKEYNVFKCMYCMY